MDSIVLISPPVKLSSWEATLGSRLPPLGLLSLASYLKRQNISVSILDATNININYQGILAYLKKSSPNFVGISSTTPMISYAHDLAKAVKSSFPGILVIIGGPHISALPEDTLRRYSAFDVGVIGEGEETLLDIIQNNGASRVIPGIIFRDGEKIIKTPYREYIKNLDILPFPAYNLLDKFPDYYKPTPNNYLKLPIIPIVTSRGCPFKCTFCTQSVFGSRYRSHSIEYLISHLEYLKRIYDVREVCFYDDLFLLDESKLYKFLEAKDRKQLDFSWSCEGRVGQFSQEMLRDMRKGECWQISYGVESGSQTMLDYFNKNIKVSQIKETFEQTKRAGIMTRAYLIVGAPPEDKSTLNETKRMISNVKPDEIHISFFTPFPGSKSYEDIIGNAKVDGFEGMDQYSDRYTTENISKEELVSFMNATYRGFYLRPSKLCKYFLMLFNRHKTVHLIRSFMGFMRLTFSKSLEAR